jgi:hypothetical protein
MPTTARANRTDGDAEAGAAEAEKCKKARVTLPVLSVLQTVLQHAAEALADKTKELTDVLGSINNDQLVAEPDVWLQHRPQRTTRRTADGSRTAQIASHGRLTACRSRLMGYPDRADDRRASLSGITQSGARDIRDARIKDKVFSMHSHSWLLVCVCHT